MSNIVGEYEILEKLGQGGMGVVYKARHVTSGQVVALKVMHGAVRASSAARARLMREGRTMAKLRHRHVVSIYEMSEMQGVPFIAMEFVEGKSLAEVLKQKTPDEQHVVAWLLKMAYAVGHAHAHGIVHRDLKPGNILFDKEGEPMVSDFGLAKDEMTAPGLTSADELIGTPCYMSPEQAKGKPVDRRSDVYSLGAIMYTMLTGRPPFSGRVASVIFKVAEKDPNPPSEINPGVNRTLEAICLKAMRKRPEDRYQLVGDMAADLSALLTGGHVTAKAEGPGAKVIRKVGLGMRYVVLGAMVLAAMLAIVAVAHRLNSPAEEIPSRQPGAVPVPAVPSKPPAVGPAPGPAATSPPTWSPAFGLNVALNTVEHSFLRNRQYDEAIAAYERLLKGNLDPAQKQDVDQRLAWARQLRDRAQGAASSAVESSATTSSDGDRLLAQARFDEAAAAYQKVNADQARKDLAGRLMALREAATRVLSSGTRLPVALKDGTRATICSMDGSSVVLADADGMVHARRWDAVEHEDVYRTYQACFREPTAERRLSLGLLCMAVGLSSEAQKEFDEAVRLDASKKADVDRFQQLKLGQ